MIWPFLLYALGGAGTVAALSWLKPDLYDDFDAGLFRLIHLLIWPLVIPWVAVSALSEVIMAAKEKALKRAREAQLELRQAEMEVERFLGRRSSRYDI